MSPHDPPSSDLATGAWKHRERLIERFEQAWGSCTPPLLEDFLADPTLDRLPLLIELVHIDLEYRLRAGEPVQVENYLRRFPELESEPQAVREFIRTEYRQRRQRQEAVDTAEYLQRFPTFQTWLAEQLSTADQPALVDGAQAGAAAWPPRLGRYRIEGEIAHGGMGQVLRIVDEDFQRPLAMKVLRTTGPARDQLAERFLKEARLTGQLQHPGIPPVHELGQLEDGRPYFIMKLIQGWTLQALLRERASPAQDLPRLLSIFESICQTLAYAHAQGILHRDLKPNNIMVGAFGEVQVMDWGLAKQLSGEVVRSCGAETIPATTAPREHTQTGTVLGTPAYMPPEQARGEIEQLDARSDVFGLGAILCEVLTGAPPFAAGSARANHQLAVKGDLADALARLTRAAEYADADLVQLARRCLAPDRGARPSDAGAVAQAVAQYRQELQQRLQQAEIDRAAALARAEEERKRRETERQKRRLTVALAAAALLFVLAGSGAGVWFWGEQARQAERQEYVRREVGEALQDVMGQLQGLRATLDNPLKIHVLLSDLNKWQATVDATAAVWKRARALADSDRELLESEDLACLEQMGEQLRAARQDLKVAEQLDKIRLDASVLVEGKLNTAAAARRYEKAFQEAGLAVTTEAAATVVARIRQSPLRFTWVAALDHWAEVLVRQQRSTREKNLLVRLLTVARLADPDPWRDQVRDPKAQAQALLRLARHPDRFRQSPQTLVLLAARLPQAEAQGLLRQALAVYPQDFWLYFHLGTLVKGPDEQAGCFQAALAVRPNNSAAHNNLGTALALKKGYAAAVDHYARALALDSSFAPAHIGWGNVLTAKKDYARAIGHYAKALALDPDSAPVHTNWGNALAATRDYAGAIDHYIKALALDPNDGRAHINWGNALYGQGDSAGAIEHFASALALDPNLPQAYNSWGSVLYDNEDYAGAIDYFAKALVLDPNHAEAHTNWGTTLAATRDYAGAIGHYMVALALDPNHAAAHINWGNALAANKDYVGATAHYMVALALDPSDGRLHLNWGKALCNKGDYAGAIDHYAKALALDPNYALAHYNWGNALTTKKDYAGAIDHFAKALALNPKHAGAHTNWGLALAAQQDYAGAIHHYTTALALNPNYAHAHVALGLARLQMGDFAHAQQSTERALQLLPAGHPLREAAQDHLEQCRQLLQLEHQAELVLKGQAQPTGPAELLQLAQFCRHYGKHAAATRLFVAAFAAAPKLADTASPPHRYHAACSAALALAGQDREATALLGQDRAKLRRQALVWLLADLRLLTRTVDDYQAAAGKGNQPAPSPLEKLTGQAQKPGPIDLLRVNDRLQHWHENRDLASVREDKELLKLPAEEQKSWQQLWADVQGLQEQVRACFTEKRSRGTLAGQQTEQRHQVKLTASKTYSFDLQSKQFNVLLRLQDARGQTLAENDDVEPGVNLDARLVFTPKQDGTYRLIATSFRGQGRGAYTLLIREFTRHRQ